MSAVVAGVVWSVIIAVLLALFIWWWLGVHRKSKEEQAAEILSGRSGAASRRAERGQAGATGVPETPEYFKGTTDTLPPPNV